MDDETGSQWESLQRLQHAPPYIRDIVTLIRLYVESRPQPSEPCYERMRTIWDKSSFGDIHHGAPRALSREDFLQFLYQGALLLIQYPSVAAEPPHLNALVRGGALFTLFLLFATQPDARHAPVRIRVVAKSYSIVTDVAQSSTHTDIVYRSLLQEDAFLHVAQLRHGPAFAPEDIFAQQAHPLRKRWTIGTHYGYELDPEKAKALADAFGTVPDQSTSDQQLAQFAQEHADRTLNERRERDSILSTLEKRLDQVDGLIDEVSLAPGSALEGTADKLALALSEYRTAKQAVKDAQPDKLPCTLSLDIVNDKLKQDLTDALR